MAKSRGRGPFRERRRKTAYGERAVCAVIRDLSEGATYEEVGQRRGRPCTATIYNWRRTYPEFAEAVDAARAFGAEICADAALNVAEDATDDTIRKAKLNVDTLMQRAARLAPERWSEARARAVAQSQSRATGRPMEVIFRVRRFEKVMGPDGVTVLREILPEGEA